MSSTSVSVDPEPLLELRDIVKTYPGVKALGGVSLKILPGRVHAVLGENGAGKSTLVGIAAGSVVPDGGTIGLGEARIERIQPREARNAGLAIVYQTPALTPALSVVDCVLELLPDATRPSRADADEWLASHFESLGLAIDPTALVGSLTQREAHLIEIAAALASDPRVLVLDEPTEALGPEETRWLFDRVNELLERQVGVVYITHRIPEVMEIGRDLTVLRDGRVVGRGAVADYTAEEIVELIVGRSLETTFPAKADQRNLAEPVLDVRGLSGLGFSNVSLEVAPGQIVGLAGVEGNGQREFIAALAGRGATQGEIRVGSRELGRHTTQAATDAGIVFLPGDRLGEAMFGKMSIRENVVAPSLSTAMPRGMVNKSREYRLTREAIADLAVKTATLETPVATLSGGSQQKVLLARSRLELPRVLLVEDPTQGVDAGARVTIYRVLRKLADDGVAVVVLSTDAVELEGLCDKVVVFSSGGVQAVLDGDDVTERSITGAAVLSQREHHTVVAGTVNAAKPRRRIRLPGEAQAGVLGLLTVALALGTATVADAFFSPLNVTQLLSAASVLILVGIAQLLVVITGGIDLSVGSVIAVSGVVLSFFAEQGSMFFMLGVIVALLAGVAAGVMNGILVTTIGIPSVIATLVSSIAIVGGAQILRPEPTFAVSPDVAALVGTVVLNIPVVLFVALIGAVGTHFVLRRTRLGRGIRAAGSAAVKANRMGVNVDRARYIALLGSGFFSAMAGVALYTTTTTGDPNSGQEFTLMSVTIVVIAGVSIFGGSGSVVATAAAGLLLATVTNALNFLSLTLAWQYWFQGIFVLLAALLPVIAMFVRRRRRVAVS